MKSINGGFMSRLVVILICIFIVANLSCVELKYSLNNKMDNVGPIFGEEYKSESDITSLAFMKVITTDNSMEIKSNIFQSIPSLSEAEPQPDGRLKYIVNLRSDLFWQDGVQITADDIHFTYNVIINDNVEVQNVRKKVHTISSLKVLNKTSLQVICTPSCQNKSLLRFTIFQVKNNKTSIFKNQINFSQVQRVWLEMDSTNPEG